MRIPRRTGVAVLAGLGSLALTGCGSNGSLLSPGAATQLTAELSQASTALSNDNCTAAASALANFRSDLGQLQGLNATLAGMLDQGATTVHDLATQRCPTGGATNTSTDTITTITRTRTRTAPATTTTSLPTTTTAPTVTTSTTDTNPSGGGALPATTTTVISTTTATPPAPPTSGGAGLNTTGATGSGGGTGGGTG